MKTTLPLLVLLSCFLAGCSILPKPVEFGQRKVRAFPEASNSLNETQRQAAELAARKAKETVEVAKADACPPEVIAPAEETSQITQAVSESLGPPSNRWNDETLKLVQKLEHQIAGLNDKIDSFKKRNDEDAGKKIEGTGFLQIPYFVYLGLLVGIVVVIHLVLKAVVNGAAAANPAVAAGLAVSKIGGSLLKNAFSGLVDEGKSFAGKLTPELQADYAALQSKLETLVAQHAQIHDTTHE